MQYSSVLTKYTIAYFQSIMIQDSAFVGDSDKPDNIKVLPDYSHEQWADWALFESTESTEAFFYSTTSSWCL